MIDFDEILLQVQAQAEKRDEEANEVSKNRLLSGKKQTDNVNEVLPISGQDFNEVVSDLEFTGAKSILPNIQNSDFKIVDLSNADYHNLDKTPYVSSSALKKVTESELSFIEYIEKSYKKKDENKKTFVKGNVVHNLLEYAASKSLTLNELSQHINGLKVGVTFPQNTLASLKEGIEFYGGDVPNATKINELREYYNYLVSSSDYVTSEDAALMQKVVKEFSRNKAMQNLYNLLSCGVPEVSILKDIESFGNFKGVKIRPDGLITQETHGVNGLLIQVEYKTYEKGGFMDFSRQERNMDYLFSYGMYSQILEQCFNLDVLTLVVVFFVNNNETFAIKPIFKMPSTISEQRDRFLASLFLAEETFEKKPSEILNLENPNNLFGIWY